MLTLRLLWLRRLSLLCVGMTIVLMALASFAVLAFFAANRHLDPNVLRTMVAPLVGGVAMVIFGRLVRRDAGAATGSGLGHSG